MTQFFIRIDIFFELKWKWKIFIIKNKEDYEGWTQTKAPPFCTKLHALPCYGMIDWMIDVRCLQLFPFFSEKSFYLRSFIFFRTED